MPLSPIFQTLPRQDQVVFDAHFFVQRGVSAVLSSGFPVLFVGAAQRMGLVTEASFGFAGRGVQVFRTVIST